MFQKLYSLNKLDIHHNCLRNLHEISCLAGLSKLYEVNLSENVVCSTCSYRELVIFKIPSLRLLDSIPISSSEQVIYNTQNYRCSSIYNNPSDFEVSKIFKPRVDGEVECSDSCVFDSKE